MFGFRFQECRLKLQPFRAASVRIVSKDYSSTYLEEFLIEVGGLDYLEGLFVCLLSYFNLMPFCRMYQKTSKNHQNFIVRPIFKFLSFVCRSNTKLCFQTCTFFYKKLGSGHSTRIFLILYEILSISVPSVCKLVSYFLNA